MARRVLYLCAVACFATATHRAAGQTTLAVQGVFGYYRPLRDFDPAAYYTTDLPERSSELAGPSWGGRAQLGVTNRFAIEGSVSTAGSTVPACECPDGSVRPATPARVTVATLIGQYDLSNSPAHYHLWAGAGPAMIKHGGVAYDRYGAVTSWGVAGGLELAVPIAQFFDVVGNASAVGYAFNLAAPPEHGRQVDALVSAGLRWHSRRTP